MIGGRSDVGVMSLKGVSGNYTCKPVRTIEMKLKQKLNCFVSNLFQFHVNCADNLNCKNGNAGVKSLTAL